MMKNIKNLLVIIGSINLFASIPLVAQEDVIREILRFSDEVQQEAKGPAEEWYTLYIQSLNISDQVRVARVIARLIHATIQSLIKGPQRSISPYNPNLEIEIFPTSKLLETIINPESREAREAGREKLAKVLVNLIVAAQDISYAHMPHIVKEVKPMFRNKVSGLGRSVVLEYNFIPVLLEFYETVYSHLPRGAKRLLPTPQDIQPSAEFLIQETANSYSGVELEAHVHEEL